VAPNGGLLTRIQAWLTAVADPTIVRRALATSTVVGTLLTLINQGDHILNAQLGSGDALRIGLSFAIPYAVATVSSVASTGKARRPWLP
jgi:hypothetical protein